MEASQSSSTKLQVFSERPCPPQIRQRVIEEDMEHWPLISEYTGTHVHVYMNTPT